MSLHRKLIVLVGVIMLVILSATQSIMYFQSRSIMVEQAQNKAVSIILTIDSALESNIPDFQFEAILLHLKHQDPEIRSFDIYKLNGSYYDIASTNSSLIGSVASATMEKAVMQNQVQTTLNGTLLDVVAPIKINGKPLYAAHVIFSTASDLQVMSQLFFTVLVAGLIAMVLAVLFVWFFVRRLVSRPLVAITRAANQIANGQLDIHVAKEANRKDEIGTLARSFTAMVRSLHELITGISQASQQLTTSFEELAQSADQTESGAMNVSRVMDHISLSTTEQASLSEESVRAMNEVNAAIDSIVVAATSVSNMSLDSLQQAQDGERAIADVISQMSVLDQFTTDSAIANHTLLQRSKEIEKITDAISEVAVNTNLLAINAAIEAARAGAQQGGFAVVAQEVNNLAEHTKLLASQIAQLVGQIQLDIKESAVKVERVHDAVVTGLSQAQGTSDLFGGISQFAERIADEMKHNSDAVQHISGSSRDALQSIRQAAQTSLESGVKVRQVAENVTEQLVSIQDVNRSAALLSQMAVDLQKLIATFDLGNLH